MYRIRTVCRNPACQAVFGVEFAETGPLEGKTLAIAFELCKDLRCKRPITYKLGEQIRHSVGLEQDDKANIPEFIECPECNSFFPRSDLTFFVYDASATQNPH